VLNVIKIHLALTKVLDLSSIHAHGIDKYGQMAALKTEKPLESKLNSRGKPAVEMPGVEPGSG